MNLDVLSSKVHFSRWGEHHSTSLSFEVVPEDGLLDIGTDYVFCSNRSSFLHAKERTAVGATISITSDATILENIRPLFRDQKRDICGWASFYEERGKHGEYDPAALIFTVVVGEDQIQQMLRIVHSDPGSLTLNVGVEGMTFGWRPDGSHLIWDLAQDDKRPICTFSYTAERFWTSESAIRDERDKKLNAQLADSPDPADRKLAAITAAETPDDPVTGLLKQVRAILLAILVVGGVTLFRVTG